MAKMDFDVKYESKDKGEIGMLGDSINKMSDNLRHYISDLKSANLELQKDIDKKEEIDNMVKNANWDYNDILGDMVISIEQVEKQAVEYGHSFERELSYMVVHSFYHLMGYDHIKEEDKVIMRPKEEFVLERLGITR